MRATPESYFRRTEPLQNSTQDRIVAYDEGEYVNDMAFKYIIIIGITIISIASLKYILSK